MTFDTAFERSHAPNTMNAENEKAPKRIWVNNPAEVTEHDQRWWYGNEMAFPTVEYVRADLLATARKEARQTAFREAVDALKAHQQAVRDRHYGVITLAIEAVEALERAATTDTDKTEKGMRDG